MPAIPWLDNLPGILLLVFGFGFVIFWHELGHFLAAKWADVKVEQFAVGFGHAILSWRKGLGFRWGSSAKEYEQIQKGTAEGAGGIDPKSIGETEYRLNWLPLGGYVKMLGQDDLNPNAQSADLRSYNMKSIGKRMIIVSAGVVMNIILAIIGFTILFRMGFDAPPPVVGSVAPMSPAQKAGIQVGDRIVSFDGRPQRDFTKIQLNVALVKEGQAVPVVVQRPDGTQTTLMITAQRTGSDDGAFLQLGIAPSHELRAPDYDAATLKLIEGLRPNARREVYLLNKGDVITAVNGEPIQDPKWDFYKLDRAIQASKGLPVTLTITSADGKQRDEQIQPHFAETFEPEKIGFAGLRPRAAIREIAEDSSAKGKLFPDDVIERMTVMPGNDTIYNPTITVLRDRLARAGASKDQTIEMVVLRNGQEVVVKGLTPTVKLEKGKKGLGIVLGVDETSPVIGGVFDKSSAAEAGVQVSPNSPAATAIVSFAGQPIANWHQLQQAMAARAPGEVNLVYRIDGTEKNAKIELTESDIDIAKSYRYAVDMQLHDLSDPRKTSNPLVAIGWGLEETRDLIVQFYQTLQRMLFSQSVSVKQLTGPVGIFRAGTVFAHRGMDWLIWFLAMISANLAVVNFLPIPIVDGGLFTFLIIEKIQGKPISPKVQSIAQVVGLALILSIFILVTVQDISRW